jgi:transcriptional regulator
MPQSTDLLQGTLDLLVMQTVALKPMHGLGVAQRIQQSSKDVLQVGQGSLYPTLYRLEYKGWIRSEWRITGNNRRAKFYHLTQRARSNWKRNWPSGIAFPRRSGLYLAGSQRRPDDL